MFKGALTYYFVIYLFFFNFGVDKENASEYLSPLSLRTNGQHPNRQCVVYDL